MHQCSSGEANLCRFGNCLGLVCFKTWLHKTLTHSKAKQRLAFKRLWILDPSFPLLSGLHSLPQRVVGPSYKRSRPLIRSHSLRMLKALSSRRHGTALLTRRGADSLSQGVPVGPWSTPRPVSDLDIPIRSKVKIQEQQQAIIV